MSSRFGTVAPASSACVTFEIVISKETLLATHVLIDSCAIGNLKCRYIQVSLLHKQESCLKRRTGYCFHQPTRKRSPFQSLRKPQIDSSSRVPRQIQGVFFNTKIRAEHCLLRCGGKAHLRRLEGCVCLYLEWIESPIEPGRGVTEIWPRNARAPSFLRTAIFIGTRIRISRKQGPIKSRF